MIPGRKSTEQDLVEPIFRLRDRRVSALMTPRVAIRWIDSDDPVNQIQQLITQSARTRFPVCQGILDNVLGIVHVRDLYVQLASGHPLNLQALLRPALFDDFSYSSMKTAVPLAATMSIPPPFCCPNVS